MPGFTQVNKFAQREAREATFLFQPRRADQMPDPTPRQSVTKLATPYRSACHMNRTIVLAFSNVKLEQIGVAASSRQ